MHKCVATLRIYGPCWAYASKCTATQGEPLSIEYIFLLTIYKLLVSTFDGFTIL